MWRELTVADKELIQRWIDTEMTWGGKRPNVARIRRCIKIMGDCFYLYERDRVRLAIGFACRFRNNSFWVTEFVLDGDLDPDLAIDLFLEKAREYARLKQTDILYGQTLARATPIGAELLRALKSKPGITVTDSPGDRGKLLYKIVFDRVAVTP